jgi:hypothetical protein
MSKRLLEHDKLTGITTWHEGDGYGGFKIAQTQDVNAILKYTKELANDNDYKRKGIKTDWYHIATVPVTVLHQILVDHHLDYNSKYDLPKIEKIIARDYKLLMTTDKA